jgi:hypothetical protein
LNKNSTPFVYADLGTHFVWPGKNDEWHYLGEHFKSGLYYNAGAGYKLAIAKKHALIFSTGYSEKKFSYSSSYTLNCLVAPCPEYKNSTEYILRRLSFQLGFVF